MSTEELPNIGYKFTEILSPQECKDMVYEFSNSYMTPMIIENKNDKMFNVVLSLGYMKDSLWEKIKVHIPNNERMKLEDVWQFIKYEQGGYSLLTMTNRNLYTFIIYLNDEYEGGETEFVDREYCCKYTTGTGILFSSDGGMRLENIIKSGCKYVLMSNVVSIYDCT